MIGCVIAHRANKIAYAMVRDQCIYTSRPVGPDHTTGFLDRGRHPVVRSGGQPGAPATHRLTVKPQQIPIGPADHVMTKDAPLPGLAGATANLELARRLELLTCCFSAAGIGGLWPGGIVWRLA